jgi:uncharacterized repeat protein (TIGR01451 family)
VRLLGVLADRGRRPRGDRKVAWGVCALFCLILAPASLLARGTPAGTVIENTAQVSFEDSNGNTIVVTSSTLSVTVGQVAGVDLEPPGVVATDIGVTVLFSNTLENIGNGTDSFVVTANSAAGWPTRLYLDANRDGALDAGDSQITGPITLAADDTAFILVAVDVPNNPALRGTTDDVDVQATSVFDGSASDGLTDQIQVLTVGISASLTKIVDLGSATVGDVLTYTIDYSGTGPSTATNFQVFDLIPLGTTYVPGTMQWNGTPLTDLNGDDEGYYDGAANQAIFQLPTLTGGDAGTFSFQVRVDGPYDVTNVTTATYETIAGTDSATSNSVVTTFVQPELTIQKLLTSPTVAYVGEQVSYTLRYGNSSASVVAQAVEVSDTLPTGLDFVSAVPPPGSVNGQVMTWTIGDVAPGDTFDIQLTAQVSTVVVDTMTVANMAVMAALNATTQQVALSEAVQLIAAAGEQLSLDKAADLIEVGIGELAPYTLAVENTDVVPRADIRIHDTLPDGMVYSEGSATGVDSVQVDGQNITFFYAGPIDPGETHYIHYVAAVVSAGEPTLANTAYATAEAETITSEEVTAWVRVRNAYPLETRVAIGKVWVDLNDNGGQDPGEPGLAGADIWTDDGDIASSDSDGKFSFRNLRSGRHAFRLDPATIPAGYRLAGSSASEDLITLDADGWTTPRINFRLVPLETTLAEVHLPITWRFAARPLCTSLDEIFPTAEGGRATLAHFETNSANLQDGEALAQRVALALANRPGCRVELAGHADPRPVQGGPYWSNLALSQARADSVLGALRASGIESNIGVRALGTTDLVAQGRDPYSLWLNRRVELRLSGPESDALTRPIVEYDVLITNQYDVALSGLAIRFVPAADSVALIVNDSVQLRLYGQPTVLPPIDPYSRVTLRAWTVSSTDSAVAMLEREQRSTGWLAAAVHNYTIPVSGTDEVHAVANRLPNPGALPPGASVEIVLLPAPAGWPEATFSLPEGWKLVEGSAKVGGLPAPDPELRRDVSGAQVLYWRFRGRAIEPIALRLEPSDAAEAAEVATIPAIRTAEERQEEYRRGFLAGPAVEIFNPKDGTVLRSDKLFIGVRGEASVPVTLFDGDSVIAEVQTRIDGVYDFIAIPLSRGPHTLRVRMTNSWGQERWDSLAVHVTGLPTEIAAEVPTLTMVADGHTITTVRARVLDRWGVPVVNPTNVTVVSEGADALGTDSDAASVGFQLLSDPAGWLRIDLRPGLEIGTGRLTLKAYDAEAEVELELVPPARPLMITGVGQVGVGSAPDAFGAITARGRIDSKTSVILSYDSRLLDAGRNFFGRSFDPLEESRYPILGDAGRVRTTSASQYAFSARIERGFDWLALGDVSTYEFSSGLLLNSYNRALPGAAARISTGPVVWKGFGSSTSQSLQQLQIRGAGTSGPYTLQPDIRPGTDHVRIEMRAAENAERIISQQQLVRYVDYQIDYIRGTLMFKRPVPASDPSENPVFIVVSYEAESGGEEQIVWGARAAVDAGDLINVDSLRIGATYVSDEQTAGSRQVLAGADVRLVQHGVVDIGAELSYSQSATSDSADIATSVDGTIKLFSGHLDFSGGWMRVGDEYRNPSNLGLRAGTEEIRAAGGLRIGPSQLRFEHQRQNFTMEGVRRERTTGGIIQSVGRQLQIDLHAAQDRFVNGGVTDRSQAGEAKITWNPTSQFSLWTEGRHQFETSGNMVRPDYLGGGASYRLSPRLALEGTFRQVMMSDSLGYSIASLGVRSDIGLGTQAYGHYQLIGGADGSHNAAVVGLNNQLRFGAAWALNTMFERRFGLDDAPLADPVRALPFAQPEEDYWSAGLGIELLPPNTPYRLSARGEFRDGDFTSTRMATLAGDVAIGRSLGILSRSEYFWNQHSSALGSPISIRKSTLWGLAFRPIGSDALNVLTKFQWLEESNPVSGGVLGASGEERRLIGVAEAIWAPFNFSEFAARYAARRTEGELVHPDSTVQNLVSWADYIGGRINLDFARWLALRGEGRLLLEHNTHSQRWDAAPSIVLIPIEGFEMQAGYRFGDLHDPDFAVRGGEGWFAVFSARLTESVFPTSADFWRHRF